MCDICYGHQVYKVNSGNKVPVACPQCGNFPEMDADRNIKAIRDKLAGILSDEGLTEVEAWEKAIHYLESEGL